MLWAGCFEPRCSNDMARGIWSHLRTRSETVSRFAIQRDSEVKRFTRVAGEVLEWAPRTCEFGPVCPLCNEHKLALLANPDCKHAACEDCWSRWVEVHLPKCREEKQVAVRCFGA